MQSRKWYRIFRLILDSVEIVVGLAAIGALWISVLALNENKASRELESKQHVEAMELQKGAMELQQIALETEMRSVLIFDPGSTTMNVTFDKDGLDNGDAWRIEGSKIENGLQKVPAYGSLVNHGRGPGLEVQIAWKLFPDNGIIGNGRIESEEQVLESWENAQQPYEMFVLPGQRASLEYLPGFVTRTDSQRERTYFGFVEIMCKEIDGQTKTIKQGFEIHFRPDDNESKNGKLTVIFKNFNIQKFDWNKVRIFG